MATIEGEDSSFLGKAEPWKGSAEVKDRLLGDGKGLPECFWRNKSTLCPAGHVCVCPAPGVGGSQTAQCPLSALLVVLASPASTVALVLTQFSQREVGKEHALGRSWSLGTVPCCSRDSK